LFAKSLADNGYETFEAQHGIEALRILKDRAVDLILLDLLMPEMDGPEMLSELRAAGNSTPVILVTAVTDTRAIADCMAFDVADYLVKPVEPRELFERVSKVIAPVARGATTGEYSRFAPPPESRTLLLEQSNEHIEQLRQLMPSTVLLQRAADTDAALEACRSEDFDKIIVGSLPPGQSHESACQRLRAHNLRASFFIIYGRQQKDPVDSSFKAGFDGFLLRPFSAKQVDLMYAVKARESELLVVEDYVIRMLQQSSQQARSGNYYSRVGELVGEALEKIASDAYEDVVVDLTNAP